MTKEDKQIIDRAIKEEWRIGDRSRLKRLLEKNLKLYRENVELESKLEQTEKDLAVYQFNYPKIKELEKENAGLKVKIGSSIDCEKAKKNGELCLGYGGDEDEPCEQCKNCIKCEGGYYQLGETEKDDQLTKTKQIIKDLLADNTDWTNKLEAEQFLKEIEK